LKIPRITLAGVTSGVGKTSITCAIIYALQKKGFSVQPFKIGPDYIDPSYLSSISKKEAFNLDVWLMGEKHLIESFASIIKSPVILILDASKTSRSIAATAIGFQKFHRNSRISGLILNKIGSKKHEILCRQALEKTNLPIIGVIYKNSELNFESRHLGLIPAKEKNLKSKIEKTSKIISDSLDIDKIIQIIKNPFPLPNKSKILLKKPKTTISIALDGSFNFYYRDNLEALRREGADLKFFSPILEKNHTMKQIIKKSSEENIPIYAECGGLMYLTKSIDYGNKKYKMIGLFDAETKMTKKMKLNYTKGKIISKNNISDKFHNLRGHEFHYSELTSISSDSKFAYELDIGEGIKNHKDGMIQYNTLASYGHLYFDSSNYAEIFVKNCIDHSRR